ncbi:MAG: rhodanese-like domain-containing protein [Desulfohalobiaceae bacterium]
MHRILICLSLLCLFGLGAGSAQALEDEQQELWYQDAKALARQEGYRVISTSEVLQLYSSQEDFLLLDVRFAYEHNQSRLPGALSLPFDLSHRHGLDEKQKMALLQTLGPNQEKKIVIYCRDFR